MNALTIFATTDSSVLARSQPVRVLGIDLGTTNSTVVEAFFDPNKTRDFDIACISVKQPTSQGDYFHILLPSVVALYGGEVLVGEGAKRLRARASELGLRPYENLFYDCKNEIGTQRTYFRAPPGFQSAAEISGKVLEYLYSAAMTHDATPVSRVMVTVPASFQLPQREDTLRAARLAGLNIERTALLDEPIAAFIDYTGRHADKFRGEAGHKNLVVFDFGGGTCDVAVFSIELGTQNSGLTVSPLSVSRYHRLGGGDIDAAIVYEILIPELMNQNGIGKYELGWEVKKRVIEPVLRNVAEELKINLCTQIRRELDFGSYENNRPSLHVQHPQVLNINVNGQNLALRHPRLTALEFEHLLIPFLDKYSPLHKETEYRTTCSIFAPLADALARAGLEQTQVRYCLAVGGSSLIPQVEKALKEYFSEAQVLTYDNLDDTQSAVARGAAYNALSLALLGKSLVQPVCFDAISVQTRSGFVELIPKGKSLPFPPAGFQECHELTVPATNLTQPLDLRLEIWARGYDQPRLIERRVKQITTPVNRGDPLLLQYRMDENQALYMQVQLAGEAESFELVVENPLTNVVNPQSIQNEILELEEDVRRGNVTSSAIPDRYVELAEKYRAIGQREKALTYLQQALRGRGRADPFILNLLGIIAGELGDTESEIQKYREAAEAGEDAAPLFNAALALEKQGLIREAVEAADKAIARDPKPAYFTLRAKLAERSADTRGRTQFLDQAIRSFSPLGTMSEWDLGWYETAMRMADNTEQVRLVSEEFIRRRRSYGSSGAPLGELPEIRPSLVRRTN